MLLTIAALLIILWFLGVIGLYTIGWFVHLLLVVAVILVVVRLLRGDDPFKSSTPS